MAKRKIKNSGGRPPIYKTPKQMQEKISEYLLDCPDKKVIITKKGDRVEIPTPTICGLCYFLGFESRQSFYDYEQKTGFSYTIKRARLFIEKEYESLLSTNAYAGAIFALKNFGWVDKQQQEITGNITTQKVFITPEEKEETDNHIDKVIGG